MLTPEGKRVRIVPAKSRWRWRRKRAVMRASRMVKTDVMARYDDIPGTEVEANAGRPG